MESVVDMFHNIPMKLSWRIRSKISAKSLARVTACMIAVFLSEAIIYVGNFAPTFYSLLDSVLGKSVDNVLSVLKFALRCITIASSLSWSIHSSNKALDQ